MYTPFFTHSHMPRSMKDRCWEAVSKSNAARMLKLADIKACQVSLSTSGTRSPELRGRRPRRSQEVDREQSVDLPHHGRYGTPCSSSMTLWIIGKRLAIWTCHPWLHVLIQRQCLCSRSFIPLPQLVLHHCRKFKVAQIRVSIVSDASL